MFNLMALGVNIWSCQETHEASAAYSVLHYVSDMCATYCVSSLIFCLAKNSINLHSIHNYIY